MIESKEDLISIIFKQISDLENKIAELKELTAPITPDSSIGRVSRMDAINNKSINETALRTAERKLSKLKHAFSNIESPDFGICNICRQSIPYERILIMPESTKCVKCASL